MPMQVRASAPDLKGLARDLREAGLRDLQKELHAGLNRGTKPLRRDIKANAAILPKRGGLSKRVAAANVSVRGSGGKVRIVARPSKRGGQFDPEAMNAGTVQHPTYGRPPKVTQRVPAGWFEDPIEEGLDGVREELLAGIDAVAAKVAGEKASLASAKKKLLDRSGSLTDDERRVFLGSNLGE